MSTIGIGLLALVVIAIAGIYLTTKIVKPLVVNSIIGVVALLIVNFLGGAVGLPVEIDIALVPVLIVALGGLPGLIIVVLLAFFEIAFHAPGATANAGLLIGNGV
jgi:hypothetical protein